jgi:hypothetical protein
MEDIENAEMRARHVQANIETFQKVLDHAKKRFLPGNCISTPLTIEKDVLNKEDDVLMNTPPLQNNDDVEVLSVTPPNTKHTGKKYKTIGNNTNNINDDLDAEQIIEQVNNNDKNIIQKNVKLQKRLNETTSNATMSNKRSKKDVEFDKKRNQVASEDVAPPNPIISNKAPPNPTEGNIDEQNRDSKVCNNPTITTDVSSTTTFTNPTSTLLNSKEYREQLANKISTYWDRLPPDATFDVNDALTLTIREIIAIEIKRHPDNEYIESNLFKNNVIRNIINNKGEIKYQYCTTMQIVVNEIYLLDRSYQKQLANKDNNPRIVAERKRIQLLHDATTLNRLEGKKENNKLEIENAIVDKSVKKMDNIAKQSEKDILIKISTKQKEIKKVSKIQEEYRERRKQQIIPANAIDDSKVNENTSDLIVEDKKIAAKVRGDNNASNNTKMNVDNSKKNKVNVVKVIVSNLCF